MMDMKKNCDKCVNFNIYKTDVLILIFIKQNVYVMNKSDYLHFKIKFISIKQLLKKTFNKEHIYKKYI